MIPFCFIWFCFIHSRLRELAIDDFGRGHSISGREVAWRSLRFNRVWGGRLRVFQNYFLRATLWILCFEAYKEFGWLFVAEMPQRMTFKSNQTRHRPPQDTRKTNSPPDEPPRNSK